MAYTMMFNKHLTRVNHKMKMFDVGKRKAVRTDIKTDCALRACN